MKINFACGRSIMRGWLNVDAVVRDDEREPDLIYAMRFDGEGNLIEPMPLEDGSAEELLAAHILEHFYAWEMPAVLAEWKRVLKPGGALAIEVPNLELAARNLLSGMGAQMCWWPLYGDPSHKDPFMCHKWGYTPQTLTQALANAGFVQIKQKPPQTHKQRVNRDMRFEARKP